LNARSGASFDCAISKSARWLANGPLQWHHELLKPHDLGSQVLHVVFARLQLRTRFFKRFCSERARSMWQQ
jgi:hypothetical protein